MHFSQECTILSGVNHSLTLNTAVYHEKDPVSISELSPSCLGQQALSISFSESVHYDGH